MIVDFDTMPTVNSYTALTIVSAMMFGEDEKDQDRARWYGPGQVGCICDGVTSSPYSRRAAELGTSFAPIMFDGNSQDKLKTVCDLLLAWRQEYQQTELSMPAGTPQALKKMLREITREKLAMSFQTTMVAAKFFSDEKEVVAQILKCGDSAFFAFSGAGELLSCSFAYTSDTPNRQEIVKRRNNFTLFHRMSFGPGDQVLVRVEGALSEYKNLAKRAGIKNEHMRNWLVCTPIDVCRTGEQAVYENFFDLRTMCFGPKDQLLVPKYLYGTQLKSKDQRYRILDYSSTIRLLLSGEAGASLSRINQHGSTTEVLPDHFYCGCVESYQDRFPIGSHFILCSDGLYSSFSDARELWEWLKENANALSRDEERHAVLRHLHSRLNAKGGDDDISFVWIYPRKSDVIGTQDNKAIDNQE